MIVEAKATERIEDDGAPKRPRATLTAFAVMEGERLAVGQLGKFFPIRRDHQLGLILGVDRVRPTSVRATATSKPMNYQ